MRARAHEILPMSLVSQQADFSTFWGFLGGKFPPGTCMRGLSQVSVFTHEGGSMCGSLSVLIHADGAGLCPDAAREFQSKP